VPDGVAPSMLGGTIMSVSVEATPKNAAPLRAAKP
jgi:hypothetical protein